LIKSILDLVLEVEYIFTIDEHSLLLKKHINNIMNHIWI